MWTILPDTGEQICQIQVNKIIRCRWTNISDRSVDEHICQIQVNKSTRHRWIDQSDTLQVNKYSQMQVNNLSLCIRYIYRSVSYKWTNLPATLFWTKYVGFRSHTCEQYIHLADTRLVNEYFRYRWTNLHDTPKPPGPNNREDGMGKNTSAKSSIVWSERVSQPASEWESKWVSEWVSEWVSDWLVQVMNELA